MNSDKDLVIATTLHYEHRSIIKSLFDKPKVPIRLLSNGIINTDRKDPLSHQSTREVNVKGANIRYYFPEEGYKKIYRTLSILSLISSLVFLVQMVEWTDKILLGELGNGQDDFFKHFLHFSPLLLWIVVDLCRDKVGIQEYVEITSAKEESIQLKGNLLFQGEHNFSAAMICIALALNVVVLSPEDGLLILLFGLFYLVGIVACLLMTLSWFLRSAEEDKQRNQDLIQFYFALMNIQEDTLNIESFENPQDFDDMLELREKLGEFENVLGVSRAAKDIFASKSPSLIVVAIGATTENLMKRACDHLGVVRKKKARPTLQTFIHEFQTIELLDDKVLSQLNIIREFRNRSTHHFNIDWDESLIVLNQFCQFVEWYAVKFSNARDEES
jgi:hypothetical protein